MMIKSKLKALIAWEMPASECGMTVENKFCKALSKIKNLK